MELIGRGVPVSTGGVAVVEPGVSLSLEVVGKGIVCSLELLQVAHQLGRGSVQKGGPAIDDVAMQCVHDYIGDRGRTTRLRDQQRRAHRRHGLPDGRRTHVREMCTRVATSAGRRLD